MRPAGKPGQLPGKEEKMAESKRLPWVDVARGYGILAVIASHVLAGHPLSQWLFTFHVPLFFFLSGFLFRDGKPFAAFLKGKVRRLLVPYFALSFGIVLMETAVGGYWQGYWSRAGELAIRLLVQRRTCTVWFLTALFFTEFLAYWLIRLIKTRRLLAIVSLLLAGLGLLYARFVGVILPWNLDAVFPMLPFFMAGYFFKNSGLDLEKLGKSVKGILVFFLLGVGNVLLGAPSILGMLPSMDVFSGVYGFVPCSYGAAFCGIACVVLAAQWWHGKPIAYLGKNSVLYFAWHQNPVMSAIWFYFPKLGIPVSGYATAVAMMGEKALEIAVILVLLTLANRLIAGSRLKWMVGR